MKINVTVSLSALLLAAAGNSDALLSEISSSASNAPAAALETGDAPLQTSGQDNAAPVPFDVARRVRDFLQNDSSGFDWRSAKAIGEAIGADENAVRHAAQSGGFEHRESRRGMGLLIKLAA